MPKTIYLTIDDFPSNTSASLLEFLMENEVPAAFFCIGKNLIKHRAIAVKAVQQGFHLGNHSYSHPHFSKISTGRAKREISKTDRLLDKIYSEAGVERKTRIFRFPYGDKGDGRLGKVLTHGSTAKLRLKKQKIQKHLKELGYKGFNPAGITYDYYTNYLGQEVDIHWTLDSLDWRLKHAPQDKEDLINRILKSNPEDERGPVNATHYGLPYPGSDEILLLHDHPTTLEMTRQVIRELIEREVKFSNIGY